MKIAICEFREETNSFNPVVCGMEYFNRGGVYAGQDMFQALHGKPCAVGGMLYAAEQAQAQVVPLFSMNANSGGRVDEAVLQYFLKETIHRLESELPIDCLLVSLHGATQTTLIDDACGEILQKLRAVVGSKTIISASCDLHANVTEKMQKNADYICGYQTYPHVDHYETGYRAAKLALIALQGQKKPHLVRTEIPMMVPPSSYTTIRGPFGNLMRFAEALVKDGTLLDFSIFQMQPWLDVADASSAIVTVAFDRDVAVRCASELAHRLFAIRDKFDSTLFSIDEVITKAEKNCTGRPIVLADAADSPNAGACGDSPAVLDRIVERGSSVHAAAYLNDAQAIKAIYRAGTGADLDLKLGASMTKEYYQPLKLHVHVRSLHDGLFIQEGPAGKGMYNDIGRTAVLEAGNMDILVCERISAPGDPQLFRHFGIEPTDYQLVIVKACTSFRAAYEKFALEICETETPGAAPIVLERLHFSRLPKYFFPFADISRYQIPMPV